MSRIVLCGQSTDRRLRDKWVPIWEGNTRFPANRDVTSTERAELFAQKLEISDHVSQVYTVTNSAWDKIVFFSNMQNSAQLIKAAEADVCIIDIVYLKIWSIIWHMMFLK